MSAVEYALGIAFLAVACLGGIRWLEDSSSQELADRGATIGSPDLNEAASTTSSTVAPTSTSSSTTTTAPPAPPIPTITSATNPHNGSNCHNANKWTPTVVITVRDSGGALVRDATVAVTWVKMPAIVSSSATFATGNDGTATFSLHNLQADDTKSDWVSRVSLTVISVTPLGGGPSAPSPALSVTINEEPCL